MVAFGYVANPIPPTKLPNLPNATLGFAVTSPILSLAEGKRSVEMSFTFHDTIINVTQATIIECLSLQLTTAKKWFEISKIPESITATPTKTYYTSVSGKVLKIAFQIINRRLRT